MLRLYNDKKYITNKYYQKLVITSYIDSIIV